MSLIRRLWARVNEPRIVSVSHALVYFVLLSAGLYALVNPPTTLEGAAGAFSMRLLAGTLAIGGAIGAPTALAGIWWLERTAVALVVLATTVYLGLTLALQATSPPGTNRFLSAAMILSVLILHFPVRWHRVRLRPYDPGRETFAATAD